MRKSPKIFSLWLIALFLCAQLVSLSGAFDTFQISSLDDLDPEEIVSVDPFVASNSSIWTALQPAQLVVVQLIMHYCLAQLLAVQTSQPVPLFTAPEPPERLWLLHRSFLS